MSQHAWLLGPEPRSSAVAASTFNCRIISPTQLLSSLLCVCNVCVYNMIECHSPHVLARAQVLGVGSLL